MKKNPRKLVLRSETIRALRKLENIDLAHVVGGGDLGDPAARTESGITCPAQVAPK
jgi:hypothetical protein